MDNKKSVLEIMNDFDHSLIRFVIQEKTNTEMAEKTGYSVGQIKKRLKYIFRQFGVKTKVGLVREMLKLNKPATNRL